MRQTVSISRKLMWNASAFFSIQSEAAETRKWAEYHARFIVTDYSQHQQSYLNNYYWAKVGKELPKLHILQRL